MKQDCSNEPVAADSVQERIALMAEEIRRFLGRDVEPERLSGQPIPERPTVCPVCLHNIWPPGHTCDLTMSCQYPGCDCVESQGLFDDPLS